MPNPRASRAASAGGERRRPPAVGSVDRRAALPAALLVPSAVGPAVGATGDSVGPLVLPALAATVGLAAVHLFAGRLRFLDVIPRSRWLSMAGGVAIAYVFVHVLPELQRAGAVIGRSEGALATVESHVYLVALAGLVAFYGLDRLARETVGRSPGDGATEPGGVFWVHVGSFAGYNALVGYLLLHQEPPGATSLATFAVAMALHFVVNDYGLRAYHGRTYHRHGRWVLAAGVVVGFAVGATTEVGELALAVLFAFLAGGVVLNVMKEELPPERESRFWAFAVGVVGYAGLLLAV